VRAVVQPPSFFNVAVRFSVVYDLSGNARTALKFSVNKYVGTLGVIYFNSYNPVGGLPIARAWFDCNVLPGTSICSGQGLPTNGDNIAQNNEIGPSSNSRFGFAAPRRAPFGRERPQATRVADGTRATAGRAAISYRMTGRTEASKSDHQTASAGKARSASL
jgi:hypothetical protein